MVSSKLHFFVLPSVANDENKEEETNNFEEIKEFVKQEKDNVPRI